MSDTTVFVVDDDASVRDSLSLLISLRGLRTQVFASAEHFLATYKHEWRGCLLTDLRMPGMSGLDLQVELQRRGVRLPVVVLTAHADVATTRTALKNGALDFIEKPADDDVLLDVLINAIRVDSARHEANAQQSATGQRLERLTPREREVFDLIAQGRQNRDIAGILGISPRTIEVYKARVMEKLRCRNLAEVIKMSLVLKQGAEPAASTDALVESPVFQYVCDPEQTPITRDGDSGQ
jgi:two-component system, LuxR family, response regulator FixJ